MSKKKNNKKADVGKIFDRLSRSAKTKKEPRRDRGGNTFEGTVQASGRGFAFLLVEGQEKDFFIPTRNLGGAMHGDRVSARLTEPASGTRGGVVAVEKILSRGVESFVGLVKREGAFYYLVPDDRRIGARIDVLEGDLNAAQEGDKAVAAVIAYGDASEAPTARVTEVLGYADKVGVDVLSVIRSYGLYEEFDRKVLDEAHAFGAEVDARDVEGRADFRNDLVITIDGEDAKDLDDAVAVRREGDGYRLWVHIADVSRYVEAGGAIDREAFRRGTSVYFPDRVLPMLPPELSNGICSLNEGVDRLTTTCVMEFDAHGERISTEIVKGVIRSRHRMTYTAVQAILDGDKSARERYPDLVAPLEDMRALTETLREKRVRRGAVDFATEEARIVLDRHTGKIIDIAAQPRDLSHRMIEEFMLAANEAVAYKFERMKAPFVYRIHETPDPEKIAALREFIAGFGLSLSSKDDAVSPADIQRMLRAAQGKPYERMVSEVALRAMQKAKYSEVCSGHFGLAATYYCHFTSPIRRYPDLSIHRVIGDYLRGGKPATEKYRAFVAASALQSSACELTAQEAEREVDDLKKAEYMRDRLGEEFEGLISGVTPFGLFVELPNTIEGMIRLETLPDEYTECDEVHYVLHGSSRDYRLGDPLRVRCAGASVETRKVEFVLADVPPRAEGKEPEIRRMHMPDYGDRPPKRRSDGKGGSSNGSGGRRRR